MGKLLSADRASYIAEIAAKQAAQRDAHVSAQKRPLLSIEEARRRKPRLAFNAETVPVPAFLGTRNVAVPIGELVPWIDWSPFFHTWELSGRYPAILDDPNKGQAARKVLADGRALLDRIVAERLLTAHGTYGFFRAGSTDEDEIVVFAPDDPARELARFPMPRQREDKEVCHSLADFIAPVGGHPDHLGAFIVTAGIGTDALAGSFEREHDDYSAIMAKALADRLAEAFAEYLHHRVRVEWGYEPTEGLAMADVLAERYRGIRPAFGYPACPDHAPKATLFALLDNADHHGVTLTESYAMYPTAAVSGLYFAHPQAIYFSAGRG